MKKETNKDEIKRKPSFKHALYYLLYTGGKYYVTENNNNTRGFVLHNNSPQQKKTKTIGYNSLVFGKTMYKYL